MEDSRSYLTEFLSRVDNLADKDLPMYWTVPHVGVSLPLLSGQQGEMNLEPFTEGRGHFSNVSFKDCLCEVSAEQLNPSTLDSIDHVTWLP